MFVGDSETIVLLATWDFSVQSPLYISFFMSFSIITLFYINVMVLWGIIDEMIERVSISLPYSSTVVINLVFVSIKSLQLPDSCNETSTAQQGTFHCVSVTVSK